LHCHVALAGQRPSQHQRDKPVRNPHSTCTNLPFDAKIADLDRVGHEGDSSGARCAYLSRYTRQDEKGGVHPLCRSIDPTFSICFIQDAFGGIGGIRIAPSMLAAPLAFYLSNAPPGASTPRRVLLRSGVLLDAIGIVNNLAFSRDQPTSHATIAISAAAKSETTNPPTAGTVSNSSHSGSGNRSWPSFGGA